MPASSPHVRLPARRPAWKWWVCVLLLLATAVNYIDRLTLNLLNVPILQEFGLNDRHYGQLESVFGSAFALGAIVFGWLADRCNVRWLYAVAVLAWSVAGFATGLAGSFVALLLCRFLLGLAESGNWPCALRTTQRILPPAERDVGNGVLQSGAAVGAVVAPLVVLVLLTLYGSWRAAFLFVGVAGTLWAGLWLLSVGDSDLALEQRTASSSLAAVLGPLAALFALDLGVHLLFAGRDGLPPELRDLLAGADWLPLAAKAALTVGGVFVVHAWLRRATADDADLRHDVFFRRFWVLATLVVTINLTWHVLRAWLPRFLQVQHGYTQQEVQWFSSAYYLSTAAGSLTVGYVALRLSRRGLSVHGGRVLMFVLCAAVLTLTVVAALLPPGWPLLALLLLIGFAALGIFPLYYSLSQELTEKHQGKLTALWGCVCWLAMALMQESVGDVVQRTGSYRASIALAGLAPLLGLGALLLFWGRSGGAPLPLPLSEVPVPVPVSEAVRAATAATVR